MKKQILFTAILVAAFQIVGFSQEEKKFEPSGKATGTVYFNYHYDLTKDVENKSQFELLRSYFGYTYQFSEKFSTKVLFDVGYDEKVTDATTNKKSTSFSAFLKNASLTYKVTDKFTIEGGMIGTHLFEMQEKFNGFRYILETQMDKDKFYSSADLGVKATYSPVKYLDFHAGLWNGEGYKKIQDNFGVHKVSFDAVVKPVDGLYFKVYYDIMSKKDTAITDNDRLQTQNILSFFLGYEKKDKYRVGAEYNMVNNTTHLKNREMSGISAYGSYIMKKFEILARFDQLASNTLSGATDSWNIAKEYSMVLAGIQYTPVKGVKTAFNFRHFTPKKSGVEPMNLVYINLEYKF